MMGMLLAACGESPAEQVDPSAGAAPATLKTYKVPELPVVLDGIEIAPEGISRFDGKPLFYVADDEAATKGFIRVFTTETRAETFRQSLLSKTPYLAKVATAHRPGDVSFFDGTSYTGWEFAFWEGWGSIPDFTRVYCHLFGCTDVNDRASSLHNQTDTWIILYEDIEYGGRVLWVAPGQKIRSLAPYGWDNAVSSFSYF
jgi:hypothetical protein